MTPHDTIYPPCPECGAGLTNECWCSTCGWDAEYDLQPLGWLGWLGCAAGVVLLVVGFWLLPWLLLTNRWPL